MGKLIHKTAQYEEVMTHLRGLLDGETDEVAAMATVVCELHHTMGR